MSALVAIFDLALAFPAIDLVGKLVQWHFNRIDGIVASEQEGGSWVHVALYTVGVDGGSTRAVRAGK